MEYLAGCFVGGIAIFTLAVFAIRDLKKFYKGQIEYYKKEIEIRDQWIEKESCGEIDPLNKAEGVIK